MSSLKIYEWNKKLKLVIVIVLLMPVIFFIHIAIQNYFFGKKIEHIRNNIQLGMHKSDVLNIVGTPTDSGYITEEYETNNVPDDTLSLIELMNIPKKSYLIYNFGTDFFKKSDDLSLTFDSLDILIEINSPHLR